MFAKIVLVLKSTRFAIVLSICGGLCGNIDVLLGMIEG